MPDASPKRAWKTVQWTVLSLRNLDAGLDGMIAVEQCRRASVLDARDCGAQSVPQAVRAKRVRPFPIGRSAGFAERALF